MKAELNEQGVLSIHAESAIESFALSYWHRLWIDRSAVLLVETVQRDAEGYLGKCSTPVDLPDGG